MKIFSDSSQNLNLLAERWPSMRESRRLGWATLCFSAIHLKGKYKLFMGIGVQMLLSASTSSRGEGGLLSSPRSTNIQLPPWSGDLKFGQQHLCKVEDLGKLRESWFINGPCCPDTGSCQNMSLWWGFLALVSPLQEESIQEWPAQGKAIEH